MRVRKRNYIVNSPPPEIQATDSESSGCTAKITAVKNAVDRLESNPSKR
jgi:hypothetical protein